MRGFLDLILIPVLLVILAVVLIFVYFVSGVVIDKAEDTGPEMIAGFPDVQSKFLVFDNLFVLITAMMAGFVLISAFYIESNPIFFVVGIIGLLLALVVAPTFTNTFDEFVMQNENMTDSANQFPKVVKIIRQLPMIVLGIGALSIILMYAKWGGYI